MKTTQQLHDLGQSLWLDNITRTMLDDGTLARYIAEDSITGLTSNPSIFDAAIGGGHAYDAGISAKTLAGLSGETLFIGLALEDLRRAADLFRPVFDSTDQVDVEAKFFVARDRLEIGVRIEAVIVGVGMDVGHVEQPAAAGPKRPLDKVGFH